MTGRAVRLPPPEVLAQFRRALEQARMKVEHVARVRLAARRAAQEQRHLPVRLRLLREIVVDDEGVAPAVAEDIRRASRPAYGAMNCIGAGSLAVALMTVVYSIAPCSSSLSTTCATVELFWPMAT